ncbi:MAG: HAMP domain-containing sensor histidine kinase [Gemmatimonadota bacterium]
MRSISFRDRILLVLFFLGAVPAAVGLLGWGIAVLSNNPAKAIQSAMKPVRESGRSLLQVLDTNRLSDPERAALTTHREVLRQRATLSVRAVVFKRYQTIGLGIALAVIGSFLAILAVILGRGLARQLSRPIDELVGWTGNIRRNEALPHEVTSDGAPEFAALRTAFRDMASSLQVARLSELESERLRAFREVARRVAHEMKNPLTPVRFAIAQVARSATPDQEEAIEVLRSETTRLEQLARDFANLGRLPEGPPAHVDLGELLQELARTSVPVGMTATVEIVADAPHIVGHYDPLRRAFSNLIRNATEACGGVGRLDVSIQRHGDAVVVSIADHGPGIPREKRNRIFEPYYTDKLDGTGLGLAIVKQAVDLHHGTIDVDETPGGGATFMVRLPLSPTAPRPDGPARLTERRIADRRER